MNQVCGSTDDGVTYDLVGGSVGPALARRRRLQQRELQRGQRAPARGGRSQARQDLRTRKKLTHETRLHKSQQDNSGPDTYYFR